MHKKPNFFLLLFSMLCMTNVTFGMDNEIIILDPKKMHVGLCNQNTKDRGFYIMETGEENSLIPLFEPVTQYNCNALQQNKTIIITPTTNSNKKYSLDITNLHYLLEQNMQVAQRDMTNELQLYYKGSDASFSLNLSKKIKGFDLDRNTFPIASIKQSDTHLSINSETKTQQQTNNSVNSLGTTQLLPKTNPDQLITIDQHNVKIGKSPVGRPLTIWYNPLSGEVNDKIQIKEGDTIFKSCNAILEKNDHLIITKAITDKTESTPLIKIDLSTAHSNIPLLIEQARMGKLCINIWYSHSRDAKKTVYHIDTLTIKESNSNQQKTAAALGGVVIMGAFALFLYIYLTQKA